MKKLIFLLPLFVFLLCCKDTTTMEDFRYEEENGSYTITSYIGSSKNITIPDYYNNMPITKIGDEAFYEKNITNLVLSDNIEVIGVRAFSRCFKLKKVDFKEVIEIQDYAFYGCTSLNLTKLPSTVTYLGANSLYGTKWFNNQSDDIMYLDDILVSSKTTISEETTISVKEGTRLIAASAFERDATNSNPGIINLTLPSSLKYINRRAFYNSGSLSSLVTPLLIEIGEYAFSYAFQNATLEINSQKIGERAFSDGSITSLVLEENVEYISSYAFETHAISLIEELIIPESVIMIEEYAFQGYANLVITNKSSNEFHEKWNYNGSTPYETK